MKNNRYCILIGVLVFLFMCLDVSLIFVGYRLKQKIHELEHNYQEESKIRLESEEYIYKTHLLMSIGIESLLDIITSNDIGFDKVESGYVIIAPNDICESCFEKLLLTIIKNRISADKCFIISEDDTNSYTWELWKDFEFKTENWRYDKDIYEKKVLFSDLVVVKYNAKSIKPQYFLYNPKIDLCEKFIALDLYQYSGNF